MLHTRKHRKVSTIKVSEQKPEAKFCQHPSASRVASQVPCEPKSPLSKQMWRPKRKALSKASGVATPEVRLSCEEKGKMPACSNNAAIREVTAATIPSPNSRSEAPRAILGLMSEATVPQRMCEVRTKTLCKANRLRSSTADKVPQRAPLSSSSSAKPIPCGKAKGLSLSADSVAYAASAPKGFSKVLNREARTEVKSPRGGVNR